jgi:hypothetical protein
MKNFAALAKRSKKTEKNAKGKFKRKNRFGKSILRKSPAILINIINQKLGYQQKSINKVDTWKVNASQYCHLDDTYNLKTLNGFIHNIESGGRNTKSVRKTKFIEHGN